MAKPKVLFRTDIAAGQNAERKDAVSQRVLSEASLCSGGNGRIGRCRVDCLGSMGPVNRLGGECGPVHSIDRAVCGAGQRLLGERMGQSLLSAPVPALELMSMSQPLRQ